MPINQDYVSPDTLYAFDKKAIVFIFHNNKLHYDYDMTHSDLIKTDPELSKLDIFYISELITNSLLGRVGKYLGVFYASFWNDQKQLYDKYLDNCMDELEKHNLLPKNKEIVISTPFGEDNYYTEKDTPKISDTPRISPEEMELLRKMHLARGDEKKFMMQKLGLLDTGKRAEHPWQRAAAVPGGKWWAPYSESMNFKKWLKRK